MDKVWNGLIPESLYDYAVGYRDAMNSTVVRDMYEALEVAEHAYTDHRIVVALAAYEVGLRDS